MSVFALRDAAVGAVECVLGSDAATIARREHAYATSHPLVEVDTRLRDGSQLRLVVKDTGRRLRDRPGFVQGPGREHAMYRELIAGRAWAPRLFGVVGSSLVLERRSGVPLWQCRTEQVASWLGSTLRIVHDGLAPRADAPFLLHYDRRFLDRWFRRACAVEPALAGLARSHRLASDRLLAEPRVVIHGELYPSNVIVDGEFVSIVDWETAAAGPAVVDLAALVTGWPAVDAGTLLAAYGDVDPRALDCARFHLAVRWLGWSRRWRPPAEHVRDWRTEARLAAARIERRGA